MTDYQKNCPLISYQVPLSPTDQTCDVGYKLVRPIRKVQLEWNNAFTKMWDYGPYSEKELEGDGLRPVSERGEGLIIPHPQRSTYCLLVVNSSSFSVAT